MNTPTPTIIPAAPHGNNHAWRQLAEALAPVLARKLHDPNIIFCRPDFRYLNRAVSCPIPPELFAHIKQEKKL